MSCKTVIDNFMGDEVSEAFCIQLPWRPTFETSFVTKLTLSHYS